jgi:phosphatidylglycerol:prolipoprotein diacylglycerol transferase
MAVTTCLVHMFGRLGCFMAGCCYGKPTQSFFGVMFSSPQCYAEPKNVPLHPTQFYEAAFIFMVMLFLLFLRDRRMFYGQLFLVYLIAYAIGRTLLEFFRGDEVRGFVIDNLVSHSQLIAVVIIIIAIFFYWRWSKQNVVSSNKKESLKLS